MSVLDPKTYDEYRTIILRGKKRRVRYSSYLHPDITRQWFISIYSQREGNWSYVWYCSSIEECDRYIKQWEKSSKEVRKI